MNKKRKRAKTNIKHLGGSICAFCGLQFPHSHIAGSLQNEFISG